MPVRNLPRAIPTRGVKRISVVVRPLREFETKTLRRHDIGRKGKSFRLAGKLKKTGKWATHSFQLPKEELAIANSSLVGLTRPARNTITNIERRFGRIEGAEKLKNII